MNNQEEFSMFSCVYSGAILGIHSYLLQIETDISDGLPSFTMVGFLSAQVKEAGDRVRVALRNQGIRIPARRITVNCTPADLPKREMILDLPVAAGILACLGVGRKEEMSRMFFAGGLSLDGGVVPVRGILPMVEEAKRNGIRECILPLQNVKEGSVVQGIDCIGIASVGELISFLTLSKEERRSQFPPESPLELNEHFFEFEMENSEYPDFGEMKGQQGVKRTMEIAAAGFHHLLMSGPPGSGKSMAAKCLPGILPPLSLKESLEVSSIYSIAGELQHDFPIMTRRPYLAPHHTITRQALTGGGSYPKPGVLSLAHRGVLFLDELPEFGRENLNILREPLENHKIVISRSHGNFEYPTRFMLVAAMNPCPCGYYPDRDRCNCTSSEILRYMHRIPGPILDRFDLSINVPKIPAHVLMREQERREESSDAIRTRVLEARERQKKRFAQKEGQNEAFFNADMSPSDTEQFCHLGWAQQKLMEEAFTKLDLSARAYHRILRTARTIADLEGKEEIREEHLAEAIGYRASLRGLPGAEGMVGG